LRKIAAASLVAFTAAMSPVQAQAAEMKYPNWFAYQQAWGAYWDEQYGGGARPGEGGRRYFECDYTARVCVEGRATYLGGRMEAFVGVVLDGEDRKTVLKHVMCRHNFRQCEDYDTGIGMNGRAVTVPDMPSSCVEEMRKRGVRCKGYTFTLGVLG
jgi:hypothetical protein